MGDLSDLVDSVLDGFVKSLDDEIKSNVKFLCAYGSMNPEHDIDIAMVVSDNIDDSWKEGIIYNNCRQLNIPEFKQGGDLSLFLQKDFEFRLDCLDIEITEVLQGITNFNAEYACKLPELTLEYADSLQENIRHPKVSDKTILYAQMRALQYFDRSRASLYSFLEKTRENIFYKNIVKVNENSVKKYKEIVLNDEIGPLHKIPHDSMQYLGYAFTYSISAEHYLNSNELLRICDVLKNPKTELECVFRDFYTKKKKIEGKEENFDLNWMKCSLKTFKEVVFK